MPGYNTIVRAYDKDHTRLGLSYATDVKEKPWKSKLFIVPRIRWQLPN